jgi:serine/threonine-protein kinase
VPAATQEEGGWQVSSQSVSMMSLGSLDGITLDAAFLARYESHGVLGRGATGVVLRVTERKRGKPLAVKILTMLDPAMIRRFRAEWEVLSKLRHPMIVEVYGSGECAGAPYIEMELAEGETLKERLAVGGPMAVDRGAPLMQEILDGLFYLHEQGVLHRDIKPANLFMLRSGGVKIGDFGVANAPWREAGLTVPGAMIGTPKYMSPEMVLGLPITASSDIYSAGVVFFEMLVGRPPYVFDNVPAMLTAHVKAEIPSASRQRPGLPPAIDSVLKKALAKRPEDRYASARAFAKDIGARLAGAGSEAPARRATRSALPPARPPGEHTVVPARAPAAAGDGREPHSVAIANAPIPFGADTGKLPARRDAPPFVRYLPWIAVAAVALLCLLIVVLGRW